jgi:hypothetical protein
MSCKKQLHTGTEILALGNRHFGSFQDRHTRQINLSSTGGPAMELVVGPQTYCSRGKILRDSQHH